MAFLKSPNLSINQVKVTFARPDFLMIHITDSDQKSGIQSKPDIRYAIQRKLSCPNNPKILFSENLSCLNHPKIRTFQECHYPSDRIVFGSVSRRFEKVIRVIRIVVGSRAYWTPAPFKSIRIDHAFFREPSSIPSVFDFLLTLPSSSRMAVPSQVSFVHLNTYRVFYYGIKHAVIRLRHVAFCRIASYLL